MLITPSPLVSHALIWSLNMALSKSTLSLGIPP